MSISGNNNILLGAGAALPAGVTSNAVVLGSATSTVYLGGAAVSAGPTALALAARVQLLAGANPGTANQVLKSTGSSSQGADAALSAQIATLHQASWAPNGASRIVADLREAGKLLQQRRDGIVLEHAQD